MIVEAGFSFNAFGSVSSLVVVSSDDEDADGDEELEEDDDDDDELSAFEQYFSSKSILGLFELSSFCSASGFLWAANLSWKFGDDDDENLFDFVFAIEEELDEELEDEHKRRSVFAFDTFEMSSTGVCSFRFVSLSTVVSLDV